MQTYDGIGGGGRGRPPGERDELRRTDDHRSPAPSETGRHADVLRTDREARCGLAAAARRAGAAGRRAGEIESGRREGDAVPDSQQRYDKRNATSVVFFCFGYSVVFFFLGVFGISDRRADAGSQVDTDAAARAGAAAAAGGDGRTAGAAAFAAGDRRVRSRSREDRRQRYGYI